MLELAIDILYAFFPPDWFNYDMKIAYSLRWTANIVSFQTIPAYGKETLRKVVIVPLSKSRMRVPA